MKKDLVHQLTIQGFNLVGVTDVARYDASVNDPFRIEPEFAWAKTAWVIASGGSEFWEAMRRMGSNLGKNPIDRVSVRKLRAVLPAFRSESESVATVFPFRSSGRKVHILRLAECAGVGIQSPVLGLLLHPEFGTWISIRAVVLTSREYEADESLKDSFMPCQPCDKPCIQACPALAASVEGMQLERCMNHLALNQSCDTGCLARRACIYGKSVAPDHEEGAHRQRWMLSRIRQTPN